MTTMTSSINAGMTPEQIEGVATILKRVLADEFMLYTKLHNYHWHVTGPHFQALHELFQAQYEEIAPVIDDVAERSLSIGARTIGTLEEISEYTTLSEQPGEYPAWDAMIANLVADHETIVRNLRQDVRTCDEKYNDMGNSDFLNGLMEQHEKMAWLLRAHIESGV
jgi:starvation-inducible DNA-binding protein